MHVVRDSQPSASGDSARNAQPLTFLLVEDDEIDVATVRRALAQSGVAHRLLVASEGGAALAMLRGTRGRTVVLLDLNLPGLGGLGLLRAMRSDRDLTGVPVVVMSTSDDGRDVAAAYGLHAAGFFRKPLEPARCVDAVRAIAVYWNESLLP
jgi:CheY-like chemotaxis protein